MRASLETEAESARQREVALTAEMDRLKADSAKAGSEAVELRSLEREAESQSQLLATYLTRYREAIARGSRDYLPVDARVFSQAQLPAEPYFPKVVPITAAAGVAGFLFASIALLLRELFSGRALRPSPPAVRERVEATLEPVERTAGAASACFVARAVVRQQPDERVRARRGSPQQRGAAGAGRLRPCRRPSRRRHPGARTRRA